MQQTFTESPVIWKTFTIALAVITLWMSLTYFIYAINAPLDIFFILAYGAVVFFLIFLPKWATPSIIAITIFDLILFLSSELLYNYFVYTTIALEIALILYLLIANEAKMHIKFAGRYKKTTETTHGKSYSTTTISSNEDSWTSPKDVEPERDNLVEKGFKVIKKVKDK